MTGIFKERNTFQVLFLFVIAFLAKLAYMMHPPVISYLPNQGLLTKWLQQMYQSGHNLRVATLVAFIINLGSAIYANTLLVEQRMFSKVNLLVAVSFVLLSSLVPEANALSAPLILLPVLIFIYQNLSALMHSGSPKTRIFNTGLLIGGGTLLYHPFLVVIVMAIYGLVSMRTFKIQEWLILLLGLLAPFYFFLSYEFLVGKWHPADHIPKIQLGLSQIGFSTYNILAYCMALLSVLIGFYYLRLNFRRMVIQSRKNWGMILVFMLVCLFLLFIKTGSELDAYALLVFPFGSIAACGFLYPKKQIISNLIFWVMVFIVIITCLRHFEGRI